MLFCLVVRLLFYDTRTFIRRLLPPGEKCTEDPLLVLTFSTIQLLKRQLVVLQTIAVQRVLVVLIQEYNVLYSLQCFVCDISCYIYFFFYSCYRLFHSLCEFMRKYVCAGTQKISYNFTRWFSRLCRNCCRQGITHLEEMFKIDVVLVVHLLSECIFQVSYHVVDLEICVCVFFIVLITQIH